MSAAAERLFRARVEAPGLPLIDVSVTAGDPGRGGVVPAELDRLLAASGVHRAWVAAPPLAARTGPDEGLVEWAARSQGRIRAFRRLGGPRFPPMRRSLARALRARLTAEPDPPAPLDGYSGIKLAPHLDGVPAPETLAAFDGRGLPVLVHGGVDVPAGWIEAELLPRLANTDLIIGHLGAFPGGEPELRAAVELARRERCVYLDTSGEWVSEFLRFAAREVPEKLVFGSAAPLAHPLVAWHHLAATIRDDATLTRIAHLNAEGIGL